MQFSRRVIQTCIALYLFAQVTFLLYIQFPRGFDFDEFHYVPSAKQWLALKENQNWEHPPLGKLMMAVGIGTFGDKPLGWRVMSTVFGALTLVGMYLWGLSVFRRQSTALWVTALTFFNQLLYVQARIGMLDTFMFAFMVWGFAAFCASWDTKMEAKSVISLHRFTGAMFGLAIACKWAAIVPWASFYFAYFWIRMKQYAGVSYEKKSAWKAVFPDFQEWYTGQMWRGVKLRDFLISFLAIPLFFYFITFIPYLFVNRVPAYTLWDILLMQPTMWDGQLRVVTSHPYMSQWWGWPFMLRPIWYAFDHEEGGRIARGVLLLGNPLIMWTGLIALAYCVYGWWARRSRQAFLIAFIYASLYLGWIVIPRKIAFYYYYYPAGMTLSLALGLVFHQLDTWKGGIYSFSKYIFLSAAAGLFVYFFPILAAFRIEGESFRNWMWFNHWI